MSLIDNNPNPNRKYFIAIGATSLATTAIGAVVTPLIFLLCHQLSMYFLLIPGGMSAIGSFSFFATLAAYLLYQYLAERARQKELSPPLPQLLREPPQENPLLHQAP